MTLTNVVPNAAGTGLKARRRPRRRSNDGMRGVDSTVQDTNAAGGADVRIPFYVPGGYIRDGADGYKRLLAFVFAVLSASARVSG